MRRTRAQQRQGTILVLAAFLLVAMMAMVAFAVDLGLLHVARTELQRSADAASIASAWSLVDENAMTGISNPDGVRLRAEEVARQYAARNNSLQIDPALGDGDLTIGYLANPFDSDGAIQTGQSPYYNAVHVRVQRTSDQNGRIPLFFARVLGIDEHSLTAEATAVVMANFGGFQSPSSGAGNLEILPFSLDQETWDGMLAGGGGDDWRWDHETSSVLPGSDGIREVNLYPQGTGSPGNRGTVDIGSSNNSTNDIARQILDGVSPADLEHHGGKIELDQNGELLLNGDTGISAGVKDELAQIMGQPRVIPIFREVEGPGNNAMYTIVAFAGIRIVDVKLTGKMSQKRVIIQPAPILMRGGIPGPPSDTYSYFVYSPAFLLK